MHGKGAGERHHHASLEYLISRIEPVLLLNGSINVHGEFVSRVFEEESHCMVRQQTHWLNRIVGVTLLTNCGNGNKAARCDPHMSKRDAVGVQKRSRCRTYHLG